MRAFILAALFLILAASSASAQLAVYTFNGSSYQPRYVAPRYVYGYGAAYSTSYYSPTYYGGYGGGWGPNTRAWAEFEQVEQLRGIRHALEAPRSGRRY